MSEDGVSETVITSADTSGSSPGAVLKRCREFHEITLEDASQATKIGVSYLKSLEGDQISGFANLTYLKGFLRIYATYLGLNPDDIARMYEKLYGAKDGKNNPGLSGAKSGRRALSMAFLRKLALPAVLLLLILVIASLFKRQPPPTIRQLKPEVSPSASLPLPSVQSVITSAKGRAVPKTDEERKSEPGATVESGSDKLPPQVTHPDQGRGFILKIRVTQNCNLSAAVDELGVQLYELTVGDIIEWKVDKSVALDLSNAGCVDIELNGKPLKQIGAPGKPVYVVVGSDGIKP